MHGKSSDWCVGLEHDYRTRREAVEDFCVVFAGFDEEICVCLVHFLSARLAEQVHDAVADENEREYGRFLLSEFCSSESSQVSIETKHDQKKGHNQGLYNAREDLQPNRLSVPN